MHQVSVNSRKSHVFRKCPLRLNFFKRPRKLSSAHRAWLVDLRRLLTCFLCFWGSFARFPANIQVDFEFFFHFSHFYTTIDLKNTKKMTFRKILEKCTAERTFWNFSENFSEGDTSRARVIFLIISHEKMYLNTLNPKNLVSLGLYYLVFEIIRYL